MQGGKSPMKVMLILLGSLLCLFLASVGDACCKVSGDAEEDAEKCYEAWIKSRNEKTSSE